MVDVAASENLSPPRNFKQGGLWHTLSDLDFTRSSLLPSRDGWRRPCAHLQTNDRMDLSHLLQRREVALDALPMARA